MVCRGRSSHRFVLDGSFLIGGAVGDSGPRHSGGVHGTLVAGLTLGGIALGFFHAENEWPSSHRGRTSGNRVNISRELVFDTTLVHIALTLPGTMLTSEGSISILLGVPVSNQLQVDDGSHVLLLQGPLKRASGEALAT